jgi:protein-S-isoprenylcysteine O-methyltransferase Ste14
VLGKPRETAVVWRAITGAVLCVIGAVWIGQGVGAVHGSSMTGHSQYTALGAVLAAIGLALLAWAWIIRRNGADHPSE